MKTVTLKRVIKNDSGVWGVLIYNYTPFALTAELPWHDNKRNISCIPPGKYVCEYYKHPDRGETYYLPSVPGRSEILIHKGNIPLLDSKGCILVGEQFETLGGKNAVLHSKSGMQDLMKQVNRTKKFYLEIIEV